MRDHEFAADILDTERELERLPGIESAISLFDMVASINEMITGRDNYPENPQLVQRLLMQIDDEDLENIRALEDRGVVVHHDPLRSAS